MLIKSFYGVYNLIMVFYKLPKKNRGCEITHSQ